MPRIQSIDPETATGTRAGLLAAVKRSFGTVPNGIKGLATSEHALEGYLAFAGTLAGGELRRAEREQIAIAVASYNACSYCLSAHSAAAAAFNVSEEDRAAAQHFEAGDDRAAAILRFAKAALGSRGAVTDADIELVRAAELSDGVLVEVIAAIALNTFTNYLNRLAEPELDFPRVEATLAAL